MSDFRSPIDTSVPSLSLQMPQSTTPHHRRDYSGSITLEDSTQGRPASGDAAAQEGPSTDRRPSEGMAALHLATTPDHPSPPPPTDPAVLRLVGEVLASEQGIPSLLHRLKQSIASAKEFGIFLKKRAGLEEDSAQTLKKLARATQDNIRRPEHRGGTFVHVYEEMVHIHERMADNGIQFAATLLQMNEELLEAANNAERNRKVWKANGLAAEQKVVDLEVAMRKSKAKYDSLAEEYDRARTGESKPGGGKVLGAFKAHKSAAQQEEELLKKVQLADQIYHSAVVSLQTEKAHLQTAIRPDTVKSLQEAIREIDSAVGMQMQRFALNNENLLLGNGLVISPFRNTTSIGPNQPRSMRYAIASINIDKDLDEFVAGYHSKVQPHPGEIKYERNPVLGPQPSPMAPPSLPSASQSHASKPSVTQAPPQAGYQHTPQSFSVSSRTSAGGNFGGPPAGAPGSQPPPAPSSSSGPISQGAAGSTPTSAEPPRSFHQPNHSRSFSQGNMLNSPISPPTQPYASLGAPPGGSRFPNGGPTAAGPPQLGALPFQDNEGPSGKSASPPQLGLPYQPPGPSAPPAYSAPALGLSTGSKPVFGVHLGRLYERDGLAVPMVVYQCIQAVDLFGLGVEGIYRQSGSMNHINRLKSMFDSGMSASSPAPVAIQSQVQALDFRNPENFFHDVNSVTGLLKQFFRDLPDPLFTTEHHSSFINAASKLSPFQPPPLLPKPKHDDEVVRRDSLHAIINSLPDPNYATLRALMLHLHRVIDNSHVNRMNSHNLAVILGPTLMGTDPSTAIADAGWQIKVIDTILVNTYQIFDED
ncbi:rho gtpase activator rgd1 [Trichoderma cornu-damae]|uniref:Rho gtpase activator rgd1 n=1 Tax=Trichoderma cornu-damae TaxID=654480 RepID=A0A9P8TW79_9HYPO|nr:rho gtpase activator rgd1 [Trichoderma cornu-damae]